MSTARIAPELAKTLESASGGSESVNVFLKVQLPKHAATPTERAQEAAKIVQRVEKQTSGSPKYQYRDLDSVLQVKAGTEFVRELIRQPEILEAKEVPGHSSAKIEPVKKREVDPGEIDTPYDSSRRTTPRGR